MGSWLGRILFTIFVGVVSWLILESPGRVHSQTSASPLAVDGVQVVSSMLPTGIQQIVVMEPRAKTMAVYHVEPTQGKIQLKSVRNLHWDLQMEQFNGQSPLPSELRQVQP